MKRFTLGCIILSIVCFGACSCVSTRPPIPPECADSLIYPVKQEWTIGAGILKIGVLEVIKRKPELRQPTLEVLEDLSRLLGNEDVQYTGFAYIVLQNVELLNDYLGDGTSLIAASTIISELFINNPLVINPCDRDLLLRDVSQLRGWVILL
jgi:hypothetical protein